MSTPSTQLSTPPAEGDAQRPTRRTAPWPATFAVAATAVAAAVILRLIAYAVGLDVVVDTGTGDTTVSLAAVAASSAVGALCGVLVLQLALRFLSRGRTWWTIGATVVLLGSLASPLAATTAGAWATLTVLHLAVGAVVILGLRRASAGHVA